MGHKKMNKRNAVDVVLVGLLLGVLFNENKKWELLKEYKDAPVIIRHSKGIDISEGINEVDIALSYIPSELKEFYFGTGNEINLKTQEEYSGEAWSIAFCEFQGENFVKMEVMITDEVENEYLSIIHEFGHYFDNIMNASSSEEWLLICEEEMMTSLESIDDYYMTPVEFFAQEFAWNCLSNLEISVLAKEKCPKAQHYITEQIEKFKKDYLYY